MKILGTEYSVQGQMTVIPIGDNALLRNNDDFYIPEFVTELSCIPQLVVRIHKLGKCVEERFAERYFQEIGVGIRFYADELETQLQTFGLPCSLASAFDGSAAIGKLVDKEQWEEMDYVFLVNGNVVFEINKRHLPNTVEHLIASASNFYTLKIGDYLYCGNSFRYRGLKMGDRLQILLHGQVWMDFRLK